MKPSWDTAPVWAEWLAMDADGTWYWCEKKPRRIMNFECWHDEGGKRLAMNNKEWIDTLEGRPHE